MYKFLTNNRDDLIQRCKDKVAKRPLRSSTPEQLANGIPLFLKQLTDTLRAEEEGEPLEGLRISGASGGADAASMSEIGVSSTAHGKELLGLGYTVDQVVHDYGDLCQAITDLAVERDAPFSIDEFRTLNRCLDNAIADAVSSFSAERDKSVSMHANAEVNERLGALVHQLRDSASTAALAATALERGNLPISGATGSVLKRNLTVLTGLIDRAADELKSKYRLPAESKTFSVASLIAQAKEDAFAESSARGIDFNVPEVDAALALRGNQEELLTAIGALLKNAFKFTHPHTAVTLHAHAVDNRVQIDVKDHCGGLSLGDVEQMFLPFAQRSGKKVGVGLGLFVARQNVEAGGGELTVRSVPATGCIFTISLPLQPLT